MNDKEIRDESSQVVTVKSDCGTRIYKCDALECYMVGDYGVNECR
jgi:hypothetical protein